MVTTRTQELLKKDVAHFFHPLGVVGQTPKIIWESGKGAQLWDTDGRQYTDMTAGAACCTTLGFARKELNDGALMKGLNVIEGKVTSKSVAEALSLEYTPFQP